MGASEKNRSQRNCRRGGERQPGVSGIAATQAGRAPPVHTLSQVVLVLVPLVARAGAAAAGAQRSVNPYDQRSATG